MFRFKNLVSLVCSLSLVCMALCAATRAPALGQNKDAPEARIKALLERKRDVLKQRLDALETLISSGRFTQEAAFEARNDLLDAELVLAVDKAQRIEILERKLENAKVYESLLSERHRNAAVLPTDVLMANVRRLDAEIALLRERG